MFTPDGLKSHPEALDTTQQDWLVGWIEALPDDAWEQIRFRGVVARRTMVGFGWRYQTTSRKLAPAPEMPRPLVRLRDHLARTLSLDLSGHHQAIVSRYPERAGIGRHIDAPVFGDPVVGVSLGAPGRLRFSRRGASSYTLDARPGDAYCMTGPARSQWFHELLPVKALRYSVTFRSVRG